MVYSVILAGGSSSRMKGPVNKTLIKLCGKSVIRRSVEAFSALSDQMVVVCHQDVRQDLPWISETRIWFSFMMRRAASFPARSL